MVSEDEADAISRAYIDGGEWLAVAELRRFFRVADNAQALSFVRTIASWTPLPVTPRPRSTRRRPS